MNGQHLKNFRLIVKSYKSEISLRVIYMLGFFTILHSISLFSLVTFSWTSCYYTWY